MKIPHSPTSLDSLTSNQPSARDLMALKLAMILLEIREVWSKSLEKLDKRMSHQQRIWFYSFLLILCLILTTLPLLQSLENPAAENSALQPTSIAIPPFYLGENWVFPDSISSTLILNQNCNEEL